MLDFNVKLGYSAAMETAIKRACHALNGQANLAKELGVHPSFISQMVKGRKPIPADHCPSIERATKGAVTCEELRPDVDWAVLRGKKRKAV